MPTGSTSAGLAEEPEPAEPWTPDVALWAVIKDRAEAVQFRFFKDFMDSLLLPGLRELEKERAARGDYGAIERLVDRVNAYDILKTATELYLMSECGLVPNQSAMDAVATLEDKLQPQAGTGRTRPRRRRSSPCRVRFRLAPRDRRRWRGESSKSWSGKDRRPTTASY